MWDLVGNPEDRFSRNEAHLMMNNKVMMQNITWVCFCNEYKDLFF